MGKIFKRKVKKLNHEIKELQQQIQKIKQLHSQPLLNLEYTDLKTDTIE